MNENGRLALGVMCGCDRENEKLQEDGCFALRSMCRYGDENGRLAGRCGAIEAVVHAMKRHGENEKLQEDGCFALSRS